jgi:O-methyltransferase
VGGGGRMSLKRHVADFLIKRCGLRRLHGGRFQGFIRAVLDEIDLQALRDAHPCRAFDSREAMYRHIAESCIGAEAVDYLEFGVYRGESMRCWTALNAHPDSRFFGFDSFEGLPAAWRAGQDKGHFDVAGNLPDIKDPRVTFVKGWFENTVPPFAREFRAGRRLVLHLDADLYGSTMLPLFHFGPAMRDGTLLIFDEFYDRNHEFKALVDWLRICPRRFRMVAQVDNYAKVCLQLE